MDYWKKRKLKILIIIAVVAVVVFLAVREMTRVHAHSVTIKYVESMEDYRSSQGYTWGVASSDPVIVKEWVKLMEEIKRKGDVVKSGGLDRPFPCYIVEFRFKKGAWTAMMQVTENRVGYARQLIGDNVYAFDEGVSYFRRVGEMVENTEAFHTN